MNPHNVQVGQVWSREDRVGTIVGVGDDYAFIRWVDSKATTRRALKAFCLKRGFRLMGEDVPLVMPEVVPGATAPYLTLIPGRSPQRKPHLTLGEAKKAILFRLHNEALEVTCMVYQWTDTWQQVWKIDAGTLREEMPWNSN